MAIKLEKLVLPTVPEIESLAQPELIRLAKDWRERLEYYQGVLFRARKKQFGKSSEKSQTKARTAEQLTSSDESTNNPKPRSDTTKQLSERYPDAPVRVENIGFNEPPCCPACGDVMHDSGMSEDSEYLTTTPKEFIIIKQVRKKARCKCHSAIVTAPAPARITPGGSYGDDLIIDATLSKYCDLIPMERYCQMAARNGLLGLPPHSLITASIRFSKFLEAVYGRIKTSTLNTEVLLADETTHRMLEGDAKTRWYLWGFSTATACFFECHDSRSGDVSTSVLAESICKFLLTDVYAGYKKSIRLVNEIRTKENLPILLAAFYNSHSRRMFKNDEDEEGLSADADSMVKQYDKIYALNTPSKGQPREVVLEKRAQMRPIFEAMREEASRKIGGYSSKSQMARAYNYFLENYEGLTRFLDNHLIPIDNNSSERLLRSHVIGRKTWYGTHSPAAAKAAAIHFTIVESCKLNQINPREFYHDAVRRIHTNQNILTPYEYKNHLTDGTS